MSLERGSCGKSCSCASRALLVESLKGLCNNMRKKRKEAAEKRHC